MAKRQDFHFEIFNFFFFSFHYYLFQILPIVPQLILPMKRALNTRNPDVVQAVLAVIRHLLRADRCVGQALVPYYRQLLFVFNLFGGQKTELAVAVEETLQLLEKHGGPDAFINIKYMIPTYESCICN
jgi:Parkin co-regulated protein